ncbi:hypothetical protein LQZ18_09600 [Lachnospiraceae bacterium ZAX-1]
MKFIKNLSFDIQHGIFRSKTLFICPIVLALLSFINCTNKARVVASLEIMKANKVSLGDCWVFLYGGMKEASGNPFAFPITWLMVFTTIPFILLNYPMKDMQGIGQQFLLRLKGRSLWWLSKCCWNVLATMLYHLVLILTLIALCLLFRMPIDGHVNMDFLTEALHLDKEAVIDIPTAIPLFVFFLPPLISIGINLVQMTLSLFLNPIFSFFAILSFLMASIYLPAPYMIGNYAMPMRYDWIIQNGLPYQPGFTIVAMLLIASVAIGFARFHFYDIINKD